VDCQAGLGAFVVERIAGAEQGHLRGRAPGAVAVLGGAVRCLCGD
jgi:hypothetical protein